MKIALAVATIMTLIAAWNWSQFNALQNPSAAAVEIATREHIARTPNATGASADSAFELPWALMEKIALPAQSQGLTEFPKELQALDGKYVYMAGVFSPLDQLKSDNAYLGGVLQPPSKLTCCSLTCDPRTQLLLFVDCSSQPWAHGKAKALISIIGKLELSADNSAWGNASLNDARIVPLKQ